MPAAGQAGIEHEVPPQRAVRPKVTNFIVGFGSIIQTASRRSSGLSADAAPVRVRAAFGYVREWNFQASTAQASPKLRARRLVSAR